MGNGASNPFKDIEKPFKDLLRPLREIRDGFKKLVAPLEALGAVARAALSIIQRPLEGLALLLRMVLYSFVFTLFVTLNISQLGPVLTGWWYALVQGILVGAVVVAVHVFIMVVVLAVVVLLYVAEMLLEGLMGRDARMRMRVWARDAFRCQPDPEDWFAVGSSQHGNGRARVALLMCGAPCAPGFEPSWGGLLCSRTSPLIPSFCPEAAVARVSSGVRPWPTAPNPDAISRDWAFRSAGRSRRRAMLEEYRVATARAKTACASAMAPYRMATQALCAGRRGMDSTPDQDAAMEAACSSLDGGGATGGRTPPSLGLANAARLWALYSACLLLLAGIVSGNGLSPGGAAPAMQQ
jgi:hypothetical protein